MLIFVTFSEGHFRQKQRITLQTLKFLKMATSLQNWTFFDKKKKLGRSNTPSSSATIALGCVLASCWALREKRQGKAFKSLCALASSLLLSCLSLSCFVFIRTFDCFSVRAEAVALSWEMSAQGAIYEKEPDFLHLVFQTSMSVWEKYYSHSMYK